VGSVERGERNVSLLTLTRLARALDVSVTDLVSRESMPPGNRLIIKGGDAPAWGLAEAEHKLSDSANNTSGFWKMTCGE